MRTIEIKRGVIIEIAINGAYLTLTSDADGRHQVGKSLTAIECVRLAMVLCDAAIKGYGGEPDYKVKE